MWSSLEVVCMWSSLEVVIVIRWVPHWFISNHLAGSRPLIPSTHTLATLSPPKKIIWMDHFQVYRVQIIYYVILDTWSIEYNKLRSHAFDVSSQMLGKIVLWPDWLGGFFVCYPVRFGQGEGEHWCIVKMYCLAALVLCLFPDLHHTLVECLMGTTLATGCWWNSLLLFSYNYDDDHDNQQSPHWFISNHCGWQASP